MNRTNRIIASAFLFGLTAMIAIWTSSYGHGPGEDFRLFSSPGSHSNLSASQDAVCVPNGDFCGGDERSNNAQNVSTGNTGDTSVLTATDRTYRDWTARIPAAWRPVRPLTAQSRPEASARSSRAAAPDSGAGRSVKTEEKPISGKTARQLQVRVYLTDTGDIERVPLEQYVRGVVAAELPPGFAPAALEAQALAARTYIVRRLLKQDRSGVLSPDADVTDTQMHQVYLPKVQMDKLRKRDEQTWQAIENAVVRTQDLVIAYEGEPIEALYFSSSNGYTENAEDVFGGALPYLRSVASPWDREHAPRSQDVVTMDVATFYKKLGIDSITASANAKPAVSIQERTAGRRIRTLQVGDRTFSGRQVREMLDLRSADFSWEVVGGQITITTRGSGHGVGMSQWGAQGMALAGYEAEEIIKHYYTGVELLEVSKLADHDWR